MSSLTPRCLASGACANGTTSFIAFLTSHDFHFACRYLERPRHCGDPHFRCCVRCRNSGTFRDLCSGRVDVVHHQWSSFHFLRASHREGSKHVLSAPMASQASLGAGVGLTLQNSFKQSQATWRGFRTPGNRNQGGAADAAIGRKQYDEMTFGSPAAPPRNDRKACHCSGLGSPSSVSTTAEDGLPCARRTRGSRAANLSAV